MNPTTTHDPIAAAHARADELERDLRARLEPATYDLVEQLVEASTLVTAEELRRQRDVVVETIVASAGELGANIRAIASGAIRRVEGR